MRKLLEVSKEELNGKSIWDYVFNIYNNNNGWDSDSMEWGRLEVNMTKFEHPHYKNCFTIEYSNKEKINVYVEIISNEDFIMNEIIRKSFYRCYYGNKLRIDTSEINKRINEYLVKDNITNSNNNENYIEDKISDHLYSKRWDLSDMLGYN